MGGRRAEMGFLGYGPWFWISLSLYAAAAVLALALSARPRAAHLAAQVLSMAGAAAGVASSLLFLLRAPSPSSLPEPPLAALVGTVPLLGLTVVLDSLSAVFLLALSVLVLAVSLFSVPYLAPYAGKRNLPVFDALAALFVLAMALVFTAGHLVLFLVAWEAMAFLSYFLVVFESEKEDTVAAGTLYLVMAILGGALLLAAILLIFSATGSFSMRDFDAAHLPPATRTAVVLLLVAAFGVKAGVVPLHVWLPRAHPAAPGNVSALMSGIMLKTAVYGLLRFLLHMMGAQEAWWGILVLALGLLSAVVGVAHAFVENDLKRLLAYSSIENMGLIWTGIGLGLTASALGSPAVAALAVFAAVFHAFNHAFFKGGLFLGAGAVHHATHMRDLGSLGGLVRTMPGLSVLFLGGSLAISALPPFGGFASEWTTLQALVAGALAGPPALSVLLAVAVAVLALSGALAAAAYLKAFGVGFLGKPRTPAAAHATEAPLAMRLAIGLLVAASLALGLAPGVFARLSGFGTDLSANGTLGLQLGWDVYFEYSPTHEGMAPPPPLAGLDPLPVLAALAAVALAAVLAVRVIGGKRPVRRYSTWDCGYGEPDARMQFSASGFSKAFLIVFRFLFRPTRELKAEGEHVYHPESLAYTTTHEPLVEKYLYDPLVAFVHRLSDRARQAVQTGSLRGYLAYVLGALVAGLLYFLLAKGG